MILNIIKVGIQEISKEVHVIQKCVGYKNYNYDYIG